MLSFSKNILFYLMIIASAIISSIKVIWLSNQLTIEDFGLYANIIASSIIVIMLISVGVGEVVFVEGTRLKGTGKSYKKLFSSAAAFPVLICIVLIITFIFASFVSISYSISIITIAICFGGSLFIFNTCANHYRVINNELIFSAILLVKSILLALVVLLGLKFLDLGLVNLILFESLVTLILSVIILIKSKIFDCKLVSFQEFLNILPRASNYAGTILLRNIVYTTDRWMVVFFLGQTVGGRFAFCLMIFNLGVTFINPVLLKAAPYLLSSAQELKSVTFYKLIKLIFIIFAVFSIIFFIILDEYIIYMFNIFFKEYNIAKIHLFYVFVNFIFFLSNSILEFYFMGSKNEKTILLSGGISSFIYIVILFGVILLSPDLSNILLTICLGRLINFLFLWFNINKLKGKNSVFYT